MKKITLHQYRTNKSASGGLYFYNSVSRITAQMDGRDATVVPHNFFALLKAPSSEQRAFVKSLDADDLVISNIGPYAQFYHYLRERHGGKFSILREVRTSSWSGFLLQESLCSQMLRPGDRVIFPSEFARHYFIRLLGPQLSGENTRVGYPLSCDLPADLPARTLNRGERRIGYIGRVSEDKNFPLVLAAFCELYRQDRSIRLHVAGAIDPQAKLSSWRKIVAHAAEADCPKSALVYHGNLPYEKIWDFFSHIDVFLFPALASVETLGRVIIEAMHSRVPVVAANYAAAPELLPPENLATAELRRGQTFDPIKPFSFGQPSLEAVFDAMQTARADTSALARPEYQESWYRDELLGRAPMSQSASLTAPIEAFLDDLHFECLPKFNTDSAMKLCATIAPGWAQYTDNAFSTRLSRFIGAYLPPQAPAASRRLAAGRLFRPNDREMFGNAGELCRIANFSPKLSLAPRSTSTRLNLLTSARPIAKSAI